MWRPFATLPAAFVVVASLLSTADASPTSDPAVEQLFSESEAAAELALDFDPWTATEQELVDLVGPLESNQLTQQVGVGSAQASRDIAAEDLDDAILAREAAEHQVEEHGQVLETFAINSFLQSDPELDPGRAAEVAASRRQAPVAAGRSAVGGD